MSSFAFYIGAAIAEIAGCFAFWTVVRHQTNALWLVPGTISLGLFAYLLTKVDVQFAGRAYAIYGGIYIAASLIWLWAIEGKIADRWDIIGAIISVAGALIILYAPRAS